MFSYGEKNISNKDVIEVLGLVNREVLMRLTKALLDGDRSKAFLTLDEIFTFGMDLKRFVEDIMDHFRSLLLCKIEGCTQLIDLPSEELTDFQNLAADYTSETLHQKLSLLMTMAEDLKVSPQPRLTLETSFLRIIEAANVVPVTTLLGHLDKIIAARPAAPVPLQDVLHAETGVETKKKFNSEAVEISVKAEPIVSAPEIQQQSSPLPPLAPAPAADPTSSVEKVQPIAAIEAPATPREIKPVEIRPHEKDVRKDWPDFIKYVKERKMWMAQDLQRADSVKQDAAGQLHLSYSDPANCAVLRQKENHQLLTEFALDFFQKPLKVRFVIPKIDEGPDANGDESPHRKRQQLANDPLVVMTAEIFNGQVGDIRIGPKSR
jgi:DNA polymerase-3 subunit gamma/tau